MNNLQNNQKSDTTPFGYDSLLPTVFPCKKIRAGKYLYRGWIIVCIGYYHPEKRVVWEGYDPESGNADFHGFSKAEIKMMIDDDLYRNGG